MILHSAYCPLPTASCRLPIAFCPWPIASYLLPSAHWAQYIWEGGHGPYGKAVHGPNGWLSLGFVFTLEAVIEGIVQETQFHRSTSWFFPHRSRGFEGGGGMRRAKGLRMDALSCTSRVRKTTRAPSFENSRNKKAELS